MAMVLLPLPLAQAQEIEFTDILRDPANADLNYDYAVQQTGKGELLSAAAALERILMVEPGWHEARLLYAVVLFRLDDLQAAARQLEALDGVALSPSAAADYAYYRDRVSGRRQTSRVDGQLVVGLGYDQTVLGTLSDIFGFLNAKGDGAAIVSGSLMFENDLSETRDLTFVASLQAFTKQYFEFSDFSYAVLYGDAGVEGGAGRFDWGAYVTARTVLVDGDRYVNGLGVQGMLSRDLTAKTTAEVNVRREDLDYDEINVNGFQTFGESGRSGQETTGTIGVSHRFDPNHSGQISIGVYDRSADQQVFEYDGWLADAAFSKEWGKGVYTDFDYAYQKRNYSGFVERAENLHYVRASLGTPLRLLVARGADPTLQQLEAVTAEISIYHERRDVDALFNPQFFEYDNTGADIRFVWGFGQ